VEASEDDVLALGVVSLFDVVSLLDVVSLFDVVSLLGVVSLFAEVLSFTIGVPDRLSRYFGRVDIGHNRPPPASAGEGRALYIGWIPPLSPGEKIA